MGVDYDELEELELDREEQTEWWEVNGHNLAPDERKGLFEWLVSDNKFHYPDLIIELSLVNLDELSALEIEVVHPNQSVDQV